MPQLPTLPNPQLPQKQEPSAEGIRPLGAPPVGGLNAMFAQRFEALQQAVQAAGGEMYLFSGARDDQQQQELYNRALQKYGGDEQLARKAVAEPGKSTHHPRAGMPHGVGDGAIAADVRGDLHIAHKLATHYGLAFTSKDHPWHLELALGGGKGGR